jgi:hypothetical protein
MLQKSGRTSVTGISLPVVMTTRSICCWNTRSAERNSADKVSFKLMSLQKEYIVVTVI